MPSTLPVIHCGDIAVKRRNKISNPKYPKYPQWWSVALTITHYTLPRRPCKERKVFICCLKSGGYSNNCSLLSQVVKLVLVVQIWLLVHIVKTSGVYLIKTKKTYYVCMAWVIFLCWCAGAIWTGADDGIHFARPFGPFIALWEECIHQPQEGPPKGNVMVGIAWISWICPWWVLLMAY